jgi:hypothetical protein
MKFNLSKISFDVLFKALILVFITYFLYSLTSIATQMKNNADVGRYQYLDGRNPHLFDTKTGEVKPFKTPY